MSMNHEQLIEQTCEAIKAESKRLYAHQIHLDLADIRPFLKSLVDSLLGEPSDELPLVLGRVPCIAASASRGWYIYDRNDQLVQLRTSCEWGNPSEQPCGTYYWPSYESAVAFLRECAAQAASEPQQAGEQAVNIDAILVEIGAAIRSVTTHDSHSEGFVDGLDAAYGIVNRHRPPSPAPAAPQATLVNELIEAVQEGAGDEQFWRDRFTAILNRVPKHNACCEGKYGVHGQFCQSAAPQAEGGIYGTCDWGDCDKPASKLRMGLAICDDCDSKASAAPQAEPTT